MTHVSMHIVRMHIHGARRQSLVRDDESADGRLRPDPEHRPRTASRPEARPEARSSRGAGTAAEHRNTQHISSLMTRAAKLK